MRAIMDTMSDNGFLPSIFTSIIAIGSGSADAMLLPSIQIPFRQLSSLKRYITLQIRLARTATVLLFGG